MQEASSGFMPVTQSQRIHTMDVLRGFALLGIFLMNVEWFTRPMADFGTKLPAAASTADWLAGAFVLVFVSGKFWTLFSLLFGMGFAVMLERATQANRKFVVPYLRRAIALALFGLCHYVFIWEGDILLGYALSALALMLLLFVRWYWLLLLAALQLVLVFGFGYNMNMSAFIMLYVFISALYLRSDASVPLFGVRWHVSALCLWAFGLVLLGVTLTNPGVKYVPGIIMVTISGWLAQRFRQPPELRTLRIGIWRYVMWASIGLLAAALMWWHPVSQSAEDLAQQIANQAEQVSGELQFITNSSWWAFAQHRWDSKAWDVDPSLSLQVFLIGFWFIQSGAMRNVQAHLPLFRKLATLALPAGVLVSAASLLIAPNYTPGSNDVQFQFVRQFGTLAGLLGALGYLGLAVVLMQGTAAKWLTWLAPAGRMALTNYLTQSVVMGFFFYGYGLGHYGMGRAGQVAFVFGVFAAQVVCSQLWLRHFRYGPFEWLWRSITYWRWQPLR
jgi:uncharacterized membrane protein YeiB